MKKISVVTPCYNEAENVIPLYDRIRDVFKGLDYSYEHIFIDNCSTDGTKDILRDLAGRDKNVKLIFNARNFGHIRSPYYGILSADGDAVICMSSDLQDPPEMIPEFVKKWEEGYKIVVGVKPKSKTNRLMHFLRKRYYKFLAKISEVELIENFTGFGLYDKKIVGILRTFDEPYPYFRGLIADIGFRRAEIEFVQPRRERGITKNNFFTLYDMAVLGVVSHSKMPLRLATMAGFMLSFLTMLVAFVYLLLKLIFWDKFPMGTAPILIGIAFIGSVQLFFIGILGEYIININTHAVKRPLVIEEQRINFTESGEANDEH